ncbi:GntR family transcriptional regulator [Clostridium sediminicola]|uniref:GntR family transcriptional regulator n=1 Tax=Clostridium sediminicola TaxID=3114879 RepID=UPI0031F242D9
MALDRNKYSPLYIQLKEEILKKIKNEDWKTNSKIPSEKDLMDEYNVGRATVREAITLLVNDGYLEKRQGIGTFVMKKEAYFGFEPLISISYSLNNNGVQHHNKVIEKKVITIDSKLKERLRWHNNEKCFYFKRIRYVDNNPMGIEEFYFKLEFMETCKDYNLDESLGKFLIEDLELPIKKISQDVVLKDANEDESETLKLTEDKLLLNMNRWLYVEGYEEPYQYYDLVVPSKLSSFTIKKSNEF